MRPPNLNEAVLDSSAVLALLFNEPGADAVKSALPGALLSTVNLVEVITKLREKGLPADAARAATEILGAEIIDFDTEQACLTGDLRSSTRSAGLSLGDRACLALARLRNLPAITADTAWATLQGFDLVLIRDR
jgi:PIN domain nuclease of toxin-antitoxin system